MRAAREQLTPKHISKEIIMYVCPLRAHCVCVVGGRRSGRRGVRIKSRRWSGGWLCVEVDFGRSLGLWNAIPVHEVFKLGGKICHNSCGSQVERPLEVLIVVQHPNVDLKTRRAHTHHTSGGSHTRFKNAPVLLTAAFEVTVAYFWTWRNTGHFPVIALIVTTAPTLQPQQIALSMQMGSILISIILGGKDKTNAVT